MKGKKPSYFIIILSLILLEANIGFGQKGFLMEERKLVDKFKLADAKFQKGKEHFLKEKYDKAEKELKQCLEILPEHADALFFLSQIDYKEGDFEQALADIEKAKANYKFIAQFYTFTHQQYLDALRDERSKLENEVMILREQYNKTANEEDKQKIQAVVSSISNQISAIDARLNTPFPAELEIPAEYFYFHGNVLFKLKKYQEAHDQYLDALRIDPKNANAYNNLINLFYMAKKYDQALSYVKQAEANGVEINPKLKTAILKALER